MIYEHVMLEHNYVTEIEQCLLDIGFIKTPGSGNNDPDKYYWNADTRREFYLYFEDASQGAVRNMYCHITTDAREFDIRLSPWKHLSCMSMATWTPLYNNGIRFGIRAQNEFLVGYEDETYTDYKEGYREEEDYAAFMPAHWFAIIAPENPNDQWIYAVYQIRTEYHDDQGIMCYDNFNYQVCSIYTEEDFINEMWTLEEGTPGVNPKWVINGDPDGALVEDLISDDEVSRGAPIIMVPYLTGTASSSPQSVTSITKVYENIFHTTCNKFAERVAYLPVNRVIDYDKKKYIVLDCSHLMARLS